MISARSSHNCKIFTKIFIPRPLRESDKQDFLEHLAESLGKNLHKGWHKSFQTRTFRTAHGIFKIFMQGPFQRFHHKDLYKILAKIFIPL